MSLQSLSRLRKEYEAIQREAIPNSIAIPDPKNWLRWHYIIYGLDGAFTSGVYYGELKFPPNYPMSPPSIMMHTPNGRFIQSKRICTSMSDYHPESWSPIWKVSTIITGLISFMQENDHSAGCEVTSYSHKAALAQRSMQWNNENTTFNEIFGDYRERFEPVIAVCERPSATPPEEKKKNFRVVLLFILVIFIGIYLKNIGAYMDYLTIHFREFQQVLQHIPFFLLLYFRLGFRIRLLF
jgi:ubiquitin-conjugating enzyme E2 J2